MTRFVNDGLICEMLNGKSVLAISPWFGLTLAQFEDSLSRIDDLDFSDRIARICRVHGAEEIASVNGGHIRFVSSKIADFGVIREMKFDVLAYWRSGDYGPGFDEMLSQYQSSGVEVMAI